MFAQNAEGVLDGRQDLWRRLPANARKLLTETILGTKRQETAHRKGMCVRNAEEVPEVRQDHCSNQQENVLNPQMEIIPGTKKHNKHISKSPIYVMFVFILYGQEILFNRTSFCLTS